MKAATSQILESNGKQLIVQAVSLNSADEPALPAGLGDLWSLLAPSATHDRQVVYLRDMVEQSIDGKWIGGYTPNGKESYLNLPAWPWPEEQIVDAFAHELHHLVRWQTVGYGQTLGEAVTTEGLACLFAAEQSGWQAPYLTPPSAEQKKEVAEQWDDADYDHQAWFFGHGEARWTGYRLGYELARKAYPNELDVPASLTLDAKTLRKLL